MHAIDHNLTAVSGLDLLPTYNPVMRANINKEYYKNALPEERELIDNNVDFNQHVRYPNFIRTFVDCTVNDKQPTMDNIQYGLKCPLIRKATYVYMIGLQEQVDEVNRMYVKMGLDVYVKGGKLLTSKLPITINH